MRNFYFFIPLFFFFVSSLFSQVYVNGQIIPEDVTYCQMVARTSGNNALNQPSVQLDYGQKFKFFKNQFITNRKGEKLKFNSLMDALNFMDKKGWELLHVYTNVSTDESAQNFHYYVMKRKQLD